MFLTRETHNNDIMNSKCLPVFYDRDVIYRLPLRSLHSVYLVVPVVAVFVADATEGHQLIGDKLRHRGGLLTCAALKLE